MMIPSHKLSATRLHCAGQRRRPMYTHGSSCLQGPVTRRRGWWAADNADFPTTPTPHLDPEAISMDSPLDEISPAEAPIRSDLVERIRREIAAGAYETPEKWEIALERLLDRLES